MRVVDQALEDLFRRIEKAKRLDLELLPNGSFLQKFYGQKAELLLLTGRVVLFSERQESFDSVCCHRTGSGVTIPCIRTSDKASCLWQQRAKKGLAFTEKRDNLQSVLGILNSKEDMEADSNQ